MSKLMVVVLFGLVSCESVLKKDVRQFIEGSYLREFENEFAVGVDSVVLSRIDGDRYLITRYSRYVRVDNGKPGDQQAPVEKMTGIYDEQKKVINELKK